MKKLFSMLLVVAMLATMSVTAFAADITEPGDKQTTVTYTYAPVNEYVVTIPDTITIGTDATVSASVTEMEEHKELIVTVTSENDWKLKDTTNAENTVYYNMSINAGATTLWNDDIVLTVESVTASPETVTLSTELEDPVTVAGTYQDTLTFTVSLRDKYISFTIDGMPYTARNGMTWEEWVASDYNTGGYVMKDNFVTRDNGVHYVSASDYTGTSQRADYARSFWTVKAQDYYLMEDNVQ